ncbi:hypothetical protein F5Y15DRAFT_416441 [Xylariaceae sp. FL0016]|nr:hypothetical protein F5Y15DRAFT_416441 [Xylariaceae sp. FL0016]
MQYTTILQLVFATIFIVPATPWSFTLFTAIDCDDTANHDSFNGTSNASCTAVPSEDLVHKAVLSDIPIDSGCQVHFYPRAGCGDKIMYGLSNYTNEQCLDISGLETPLAWFRTTGCM